MYARSGYTIVDTGRGASFTGREFGDPIMSVSKEAQGEFGSLTRRSARVEANEEVEPEIGDGMLAVKQTGFTKKKHG